MVRARPVAGIVALMTMLSGCAGGGTTDPSLGDGGDADDRATGGGNATELLRFDADPGNSTLHANGTFPAGGNCVPLSCGQRTDAYDVTGSVSTIVPTLVRATLVVDDEAADPEASVVLSLEPNDARMIRWHSEETGQGASLYAVLVRNAEPVQVNVVDKSYARSADVTYSLVVEIVVDPTLVFPNAPVEVMLRSNQTVSIDAVPSLAPDPSTTGAVDVVVYDPQDEPILRAEGDVTGVDVTLPPDAASGRYVLLVTGGSSPVRAETEDVEDPMRLIPFQIVEGERRDVDGQGTATWDFTLTQTPVSVGVRVLYEGARVQGTEDAELRLTGPAGVLLERSPGSGGVALGGTSTYSYSTAYGLEEVTPGEYTVEYQSGHATPTALYEFVVKFER